MLLTYIELSASLWNPEWVVCLVLPATQGEALSCYAHLCAVRVFVESILRYGLPPQFLSVVIKPPSRASAETKLRDTLRKTFAPLTQGSAHYHDGLDDHKDDAALLGVLGGSGASGDGDKYPYYSLTISVS